MFFGKKKLPAVERFMRAEMKIDFDFEGYSKHHIFNNLSANSELVLMNSTKEFHI